MINQFSFKWQLVGFINEKLNELDLENLESELDLQYQIISLLYNFFNDRKKNPTQFSLRIFNCYYLPIPKEKEKSMRKSYPDLLVLIDNITSILIELKFFRDRRKFTTEELEHDFKKMSVLCANLKKKEYKNETLISIEIIIDDKNHFEELNSFVQTNPKIKLYNNRETSDSVILYKIISKDKNSLLGIELDRLASCLRDT